MRMPLVSRDLIARLNRVALVFAVLLLVTLGVVWARTRTRDRRPIVFKPSAYVMLTPPEGGVWPSGKREQWLVAVNLRCPHCQAHLHALAERIAGRPAPPALGAILVDQLERPDPSPDFHLPLAAGVWWDSTAVWRLQWQRAVYGETFRFGADGRFLGSTPTGVVPDSLGSRM